MYIKNTKSIKAPTAVNAIPSFDLLSISRDGTPYIKNIMDMTNRTKTNAMVFFILPIHPKNIIYYFLENNLKD